MGKATRLRTKLKSVARHWTPWESVPITEEMRTDHPHLAHCKEILANSRFEVQLFHCASNIGGVVQMNVSRHGDLEKISWEELQRIKKEIFGNTVVAIEIYPAKLSEWTIAREVRVLWIMPSSYQLPVGLHLPNAWGCTA